MASHAIANLQKRRTPVTYVTSHWHVKWTKRRNQVAPVRPLVPVRTKKEHKTLALKDFQDQDIEAVLKRPAFC